MSLAWHDSFTVQYPLQAILASVRDITLVYPLSVAVHFSSLQAAREVNSHLGLVCVLALIAKVNDSPRHCKTDDENRHSCVLEGTEVHP